ncbi:hypothetical protein CPAR01_14396 [Colletotrichum paranaense]|uniref:Uncharacterized protein n=1 Tax=Colletotrichum paranaense TaxID=1914294 RepID=A0ABQ9S229_9PEZI|nr:uncharacterized protein CPAR01_14396 [Colletotrichum paranaense]KAK1522853.1 hypothetical protein CPAR01_14396 [Colletotrichum paranaense]
MCDTIVAGQDRSRCHFEPYFGVSHKMRGEAVTPPPRCAALLELHIIFVSDITVIQQCSRKTTVVRSSSPYGVPPKRLSLWCFEADRDDALRNEVRGMKVGLRSKDITIPKPQSY